MIGHRRADGGYDWVTAAATRAARELAVREAMLSVRAFTIMAKSTEDPTQRSGLLDRVIEHGLALDRARADLLQVTS